MANEPTFWESLPRPIVGLAPMDGVTDYPFRHIQKKYGNPMVVYTEFTAVERICAGEESLFANFLYDEGQRPIIAQIFGRSPACFRQAAILLCRMGFDGIDINMGCPAKSVAQTGAGAALIKTPDVAQAIVRATKKGVAEWRNGATERDCPDVPEFIADRIAERHRQLPLAYRTPRPVPVSIKTRIGYDDPAIREWVPRLLECEPAAIGIHGRTLAQGYGGQADWEEIGRAAEMARETQTLILGNGDVESLAEAQEQATGFGVDGVLIGRASYGNPYVFRPRVDGPADAHPSAEPARSRDKYARLHIALEHALLYEASLRQMEQYHFLPMRKHLGWYARGVPGASGLRRELTQASSAPEVVSILTRYFVYRRQWETAPAVRE